MLIFLIILGALTFICAFCSIISLVLITKFTKQEKIVIKTVKILSIIIVVLSVILLAVGISNKNIKENNSKFNEIDINEYQNISKKNDLNLVLVARPSCSFCEKFTPVLKEATRKLNIEVNYLNIEYFTIDDTNKLNEILAAQSSHLDENYSYLKTGEWGTPLLLITKNNKIVDVNHGYTELNLLNDFLIRNGYGK